MNDSYVDLMKLLYLLHAKASAMKDKYGQSNIDEIGINELNSDIAMEFRRTLTEKRIEFLVNYETAKEETLPKIKEYVSTPNADEQAFYEAPFFETQALISESTSLVYEKKPDTGVIIIHEQGNNRKDRYTSCSYGNYFASLIERENIAPGEDYEYGTFIN